MGKWDQHPCAVVSWGWETEHAAAFLILEAFVPAWHPTCLGQHNIQSRLLMPVHWFRAGKSTFVSIVVESRGYASFFVAKFAKARQLMPVVSQ